MNCHVNLKFQKVREKTDAELIVDNNFEVDEAYMEQIEHYKKAHKGSIKNW